MFEVYVQLLDEGTIVYRPVPATKMTESVCLVGGNELYNPEIETWEFSPGSQVMYEQKELDGDVVSVATKLVSLLL
jgi:hypothetical protein